MKAGVLDYRMGNLASVAKALEHVGASPTISDQRSALESSDVLILPGVGNFTAGMKNLESLGLVDWLIGWAQEARPVVGICLGMQLLFERSEEGDSKGLGVLQGEVVKLPAGQKVPHMGWNTLEAGAGTSFERFSGKYFYFVHSYICNGSDIVDAAYTDYAGRFVSALRVGSIVGVQFHPEKSGADGLDLLGSLIENSLE